MNEDWTPSHWNQKISGFCESQQKDGNNPEWGNVATSIFFLFWGSYGLYNLQYSITVWKMVFSLILVIGVTSAAFHYTLSVGWGLMDAVPMITAAYLGLYHSIDVVMYTKFRTDKDKDNNDYYNHITSLAGVLCAALLSFCLVWVALSGQQNTVFVVMFGLPFLILLVVLLYARFAIYHEFVSPDSTPIDDIASGDESSNEFEYAFYHLWKGFVFFIVSAVLWLVTELYCQEFPWLMYVPGHAIWHYAVSFSIYTISQFLVFCDAWNKKTFPHFRKPQYYKSELIGQTAMDYFCMAWFWMTPLVVLDSKDQTILEWSRPFFGEFEDILGDILGIDTTNSAVDHNKGISFHNTDIWKHPEKYKKFLSAQHMLKVMLHQQYLLKLQKEKRRESLSKVKKIPAHKMGNSTLMQMTDELKTQFDAENFWKELRDAYYDQKQNPKGPQELLKIASNEEELINATTAINPNFNTVSQSVARASVIHTIAEDEEVDSGFEIVTTQPDDDIMQELEKRRYRKTDADETNEDTENVEHDDAKDGTKDDVKEEQEVPVAAHSSVQDTMIFRESVIRKSLGK